VAVDLADIVKRQWFSGEVDPDLVMHARELVNLVQKQNSEMERKNPHR
jgi:hypothetical protein